MDSGVGVFTVLENVKGRDIAVAGIAIGMAAAPTAHYNLTTGDEDCAGGEKGGILKRILFVCTGNVDRSRTAEDLVLRSGGYEVRSAGTWAGAVRNLSMEDIEWADRIFAMEDRHRATILRMVPAAQEKITILGVPDIYRRHDPKLVELLERRLREEGLML